MEQRAYPGFAGLQKPSDANITLSTISFHSAKIYCLTRVIFSGARCCNIVQQPPKRPAGRLCFCISAVHHWSRPFGAKSVVAFSLASVSTLCYFYGGKLLSRLALRPKYLPMVVCLLKSLRFLMFLIFLIS